MSIPATAARTQHKTVEVDGLDIFYREGGDPANPAVLLLHGFPTSSFMFRNLIPALADEFHLVAPDYPSYGHSSFPAKHEFDYTFERFYEIVLGFVDAVGLDTFSIYIQDYGAPIGLRIASRHPERVQALIVQNGNAYMDGFTPDVGAALRLRRKPEPRDGGAGARPLDVRGDQVALDARNAEPRGRSTGGLDPRRPQPRPPRQSRHPAGHLL